MMSRHRFPWIRAASQPAILARVRRCIPATAMVALLVGALACGRSTAPEVDAHTPAPPVASTGVVFALMDPGASTTELQAYAAMPSVDGLAFRIFWSSLEPAARRYTWTALDSAFGIVRQQGKKLTLHLAASSIGVPSWLTPAGMKTYTYTVPSGARTDPIPWDSVYLASYTEFVAALGAHVQSAGYADLLAAVSDPVPVAEMTVGGCVSGALPGGIAYSRSQYLAAWQRSVAAYASAFPGVRLYISAPIAFICRNDGDDGSAFYAELMTSARSLTGTAAIFAADLNALGSQRLGQTGTLGTQVAIGLQTIWSYTDDPTNRMQGPLRSAICFGWRTGARYVELYKADLTTPDVAVQGAIASARTGQGC